MNLPAIKEIAQAELGDKRSSPYNERGDKFTHGERVATLALRLHQLILPDENINNDILTVAAWFHDIRNGVKNHAVLGAERTKDLLAPHCGIEELEQICSIIAVHDDRKPPGKIYSHSIKIHQDADHLDHFGSFDIWRLTAYTIGHDETINDALHYLKNKWPMDNARWRSELHFDLSRKIFDEKTKFMQFFIERFTIEVAGGIWREDALLGS
jgi:uncharacterized protein